MEMSLDHITGIKCTSTSSLKSNSLIGMYVLNLSALLFVIHHTNK